MFAFHCISKLPRNPKGFEVQSVFARVQNFFCSKIMILYYGVLSCKFQLKAICEKNEYMLKTSGENIKYFVFAGVHVMKY